MKKALSIILAIMLVLSMAVTVCASTGVGQGDSESTAVKGTYSEKTVKTVYSLDIAWEGLSFTYNAEYKGEWNADTHTYENGTAAGWAAGTGKITVTNHSNTGITAVAKYTANADYKTAGMTFSTNSLQVATADNGTGSAVVGSITVTPNGSLPEGTNNVEIGTITITIS